MTMTSAQSIDLKRRWLIPLALTVAFGMVGQMAPSLARSGASIDLTRVEAAIVEAFHHSPAERLSVIVTKTDPSSSSLETQIIRSGGRVVAPLPMVDGFSAEIPAGAADQLSADPSLRSLSLNRTGKFEALNYEAGIASTGTKSIGATKLWAKGNYGAGVGIAVIDTGISPMNDFKGQGMRLVHGPDLSGEGTIIDTYGHGTVMAGIIAGDGSDSLNAPGGAHVGAAPEAWLVSVKVAGANGATDVSTVLAAMHWVAAYRDQFNIRVMNLAWGTDSTQSYKVDPLNYAVERLWQLGITVVVAAGNGGPSAGTITKPGDDPFVITVGAYDDKQNADPSDDSIPAWTSRGPTTADGLSKPDLVAPGRRVTSVRSYGSTIEKDFPKALYAPSYIRGSGSSQSAAAVAGAAALLIRSKPHLAPDQVKYLLTKTASPMAMQVQSVQGAGRVDVAAAASSTDEGYANKTVPPSTGLGSLEASRGTRHVYTDCDGDGVEELIQGELTVQCQAWDGGSWTGGSWTGEAWTGGSWTGGSWTGGSWTGGSWTGGSWTGGSWTGGSWTGGSWTGGSWTGGSWTGGSWTQASWNGGSWTGGSWTGGSWTGGSWTGGSWTGGSWTGGSWTGGSWTGGSWTGGSWTETRWAGGSWTGGSWTTAFWGENPPAGIELPGEVTDKGDSLLTSTKLL